MKLNQCRRAQPGLLPLVAHLLGLGLEQGGQRALVIRAEPFHEVMSLNRPFDEQGVGARGGW